MPKRNLSDLRSQVERFLCDFKNLLDTNGERVMLRRYKNEQTKIRLGLTDSNCVDILYSLTPDDYYKGPSKDKYHPGNYWEFGTKVDGNPIYIKIKIASDNHGDDWPVCYSFHDPEFPLKYPLRRVE